METSTLTPFIGSFKQYMNTHMNTHFVQSFVAAELGITSESLWRFENLVHSIYGGETEGTLNVK